MTIIKAFIHRCSRCAVGHKDTLSVGLLSLRTLLPPCISYRRCLVRVLLLLLLLIRFQPSGQCTVEFLHLHTYRAV